MIEDSDRVHRLHHVAITRREYFAALAMQAWITKLEGFVYQEITSRSVDMADALIEELDKENK